MTMNGSWGYHAADDDWKTPFTRKGNTLYMHVHFWPGESFAVAGLQSNVRAARLLANGQPVRFAQDKFRALFSGLPRTAPDSPESTIAIDCETEPKQDNIFVRNEHPRSTV